MHRLDFLFELVRRRLIERYVGSTSVVLWMLLSPLVPLLLNMLVFFFIARIPEVQSMGVAGYAAFAFSGLLAFRILQRAAAEGCDLLVANLEMLRSVNFPLTYLSIAAVGGLMADVAVQVLFMLVLLALSGFPLGQSLLALPAALAIVVALAIGASWLTSMGGYVAREVQELVNLAFTALLYLSPALYPAEAAPGILRQFIELNPMTHVVIMFRDAFLGSGRPLHISSWMYSAAMAAAVLLLGFFGISRLKRVVGDLV